MAAEHGSKSALYFLGGMYELGLGVTQDYVIALMWFNLAASNGSEYVIKKRDKLAEKMTPAQISKAQDMARECVKKNYKNCD